ncbi:TIGR02444 family protein [Vibrio cholerae]
MDGRARTTRTDGSSVHGREPVETTEGQAPQAARLSHDDLWAFCLQYYSVREVKDACLSMQNRYGGNVNLLLLVRWLDEQRLSFDEQGWTTLHASLARCEPLLHSYRELRRKLKLGAPDTLYREALQFELELEKQQQIDLLTGVNTLTLQDNQGEPLTLHYCRQQGAEPLYTALHTDWYPNVDNPPKTEASKG